MESNYEPNGETSGEESSEQYSPPVHVRKYRTSESATNKRNLTQTFSWSDEQVDNLIFYWQQEACLFDVNHTDYHNANRRRTCTTTHSRPLHKYLHASIAKTCTCNEPLKGLYESIIQSTVLSHHS